ncbi:hypothetical protein KCP75_04620 [Salmonella enterica subsp. enterica]|nr:hypothetical protein KCP75_04620 [Salmonella enterica subsp. enterica]
MIKQDPLILRFHPPPAPGAAVARLAGRRLVYGLSPVSRWPARRHYRSFWSFLVSNCSSAGANINDAALISARKHTYRLRYLRSQRRRRAEKEGMALTQGRFWRTAAALLPIENTV